MTAMNILFAGESWIKHTIHMKGFDQFHSTEYQEGADVFLRHMADAGHKITYIRGHEISSRFARSAEELSAFDVVTISDIGANSLNSWSGHTMQRYGTPSSPGPAQDMPVRQATTPMVGITS